MPKAKTPRVTKGLGPRYGYSVRKRFSKAITILRQVRPCPSCGSERFKRTSTGIWACKKCGYVVAGGAYEP